MAKRIQEEEGSPTILLLWKRNPNPNPSRHCRSAVNVRRCRNLHDHRQRSPRRSVTGQLPPRRDFLAPSATLPRHSASVAHHHPHRRPTSFSSSSRRSVANLSAIALSPDNPKSPSLRDPRRYHDRNQSRRRRAFLLRNHPRFSRTTIARVPIRLLRNRHAQQPRQPPRTTTCTQKNHTAKPQKTQSRHQQTVRSSFSIFVSFTATKSVSSSSPLPNLHGSHHTPLHLPTLQSDLLWSKLVNKPSLVKVWSTEGLSCNFRNSERG
ncbi:hypothetical protein LR48_Vigan06g090400 [Vigna angularis]|uniref:Uncharacterized protein n=1 Tax=Phaseolus angularis TaxID=3914 RepID=A0A0L9US74_PHAAN|nr:hypothetical protein LR48_Vigan06g090400 [Vigna angularis]